VEAIILSPVTWVVVALTIGLLDVFVLGFVLLPFSLAAGLIAVLGFVDQLAVLGAFRFFNAWTDLALAYGVLVVLAYLLLRNAVRRWNRGRKDVNDY
jgi:membrane protein implicated in regulation of membrane protease activity